MTGAKRDNKGKPDLSLIPYCFETAVARVMMHGAEVYGRYNYLKGHTISNLVASAKRHLGRIQAGEDTDESGESHWAHVAANMLMAIHQHEVGTLRDDRHKETPATTETTDPEDTRYQIIATANLSKSRLVVGDYPDIESARRMVDFHQQDWGPNFGFALTIEEVRDDDQDTEPT